jgi:hypothetical protein
MPGNKLVHIVQDSTEFENGFGTSDWVKFDDCKYPRTLDGRTTLDRLTSVRDLKIRNNSTSQAKPKNQRPICWDCPNKKKQMNTKTKNNCIYQLFFSEEIS